MRFARYQVCPDRKYMGHLGHNSLLRIPACQSMFPPPKTPPHVSVQFDSTYSTSRPVGTSRFGTELGIRLAPVIDSKNQDI